MPFQKYRLSGNSLDFNYAVASLCINPFMIVCPQVRRQGELDGVPEPVARGGVRLDAHLPSTDL